MSLDLKLIRNLNDSALISQLKFEVGEERKHLSHVLTYLREVERRKLFTLYGYSSLFTFVVKELGFSEGSAFRRISAMRLIRDLPEIEDKIADGSLNLSNATSAQKLFNTEAQNQKPRSVEEKLEVIAKLENKTAREGEKEIAKISPQAPVPTTEKTRPVSPKQVELKMIVSVEFIERMQTLKDRLSHKFPKLSHLELFQYLVDQELKKAEPRTSLRKNFGDREDYKRPSDQGYRRPEGGESKRAGGEAPKRSNSDEFKRASHKEFERASDGGFEWSHILKGTQKTQSARDHFTSAQKFQVLDKSSNKIETEGNKDFVDFKKSANPNARPPSAQKFEILDKNSNQIESERTKGFVDATKVQSPDAPSTSAQKFQIFDKNSNQIESERAKDFVDAMKVQSPDAPSTSAQKFQIFDTNANQIAGEKSQHRNTADFSAPRPSHSAQHSRYIPANLKRAIRRTYRDRCAYVSSINGKRCNETRFLDFDHITPLALGGKSEESNLRLLCRAHNHAEAARIFGQQKMSFYSRAAR